MCKNYRGITLLSILGKVFNIIVLNRMKTSVDDVLRENQAGFRKGRSCNDMIFALKQVIEKSLEFQKPCYINFVDFKQAFDSIDRDVMWKILDMYGLPEKFIRIIKQSYDGFSCCVRTTEGISPWFNVTTGVRQGFIWSTLLFNIVIDWLLKKTNLLQSTKCGI